MDQKDPEARSFFDFLAAKIKRRIPNVNKALQGPRKQRGVCKPGIRPAQDIDIDPRAVVDQLTRMAISALVDTQRMLSSLRADPYRGRKIKHLKKWAELTREWGYDEIRAPIIARIESLGWSNKSIYYDSALNRITMQLRLYRVEYAPALASCILWYAGFADFRREISVLKVPRGAERLFSRDAKHKILETQERKTIGSNAERRIRNLIKSGIGQLEAEAAKLPEGHPGKPVLLNTASAQSKALVAHGKRKNRS